MDDDVRFSRAPPDLNANDDTPTHIVHPINGLELKASGKLMPKTSWRKNVTIQQSSHGYR